MKKIIVIEDDPMIGKILWMKLDSELKAKGVEAQVLRAKNGEEGLALIRTENPDMVITDLMMPVKSGFEMLTEMKEIDNGRGTYMIALSNLSDAVDIERATNLGIHEYFIKSNTSINKVVDHIVDQIQHSSSPVGTGL